jgi:flagellar hook-length control protein FliK
VATTAEVRVTTTPHADPNAIGDVNAARPHRPGTGDRASDAGGGTGGKSPSDGKAQATEAFTPDVAQPATTTSTHASTTPVQSSTAAHATGAARVETPNPSPQVSSPPVREPQHAAPPPLPAPAPDIDRLVRLDQMRATPRRDGGEMRIEVTPEGLGPVEVRVVVRADAVHATMLSNHEGAREALTAGRSSLEAALERSNLRLEGFTVDVGQQHGQPETEQQRGASANAAWLRANGFEAPAPTSPLGVSAAADQGLSLRA